MAITRHTSKLAPLSKQPAHPFKIRGGLLMRNDLGDAPSGSGPSPKGGAASSTASPAKPSVPNAVKREDFPQRPYGQRAWEIHRDTGAHPFEALALALDEERQSARAAFRIHQRVER